MDEEKIITVSSEGSFAEEITPKKKTQTKKPQVIDEDLPVGDEYIIDECEIIFIKNDKVGFLHYNFGIMADKPKFVKDSDKSLKIRWRGTPGGKDFEYTIVK